MLIAACIRDKICTRETISIHRIGQRRDAIADADSRTDAIEMEVIIDIFLILIEIIDEYLRGVRGMIVYVRSRMREEERIRLEIIADECTGIILVEGRSHHQLVRQIAGDDRIDEGGSGKGFGFGQIIDINGRCVFFRYGLDTDISESEIGSDGGMNERMGSSGAIDAIGSAVADLGIGNKGIDIREHQAIEGMVMDSASVHAEGRQRSDTGA